MPSHDSRLFLVIAGSVGERVYDLLRARGVPIVCYLVDQWCTWDEQSFLEAIEDVQPSATAAVLARPYPARMQSFNAAAFQAGVPWTIGQLDMTLIQIGPTVIPGETACYTCFLKRFFTNSGLSRIDMETFAFYDREPMVMPSGRLAVLESFAAGLIALEIGRLLQHAPLSTKGRYWYIDPLRHGQGSHAIVPTPWCAVCSQQNDPQAWSYETLVTALTKRMKWGEKNNV